MSGMSNMELAIMSEIDFILWNDYEVEDRVLFNLENRKLIKNRVLDKAYRYIDEIVTDAIEEFREVHKDEIEQL